MTPQWDGTVSSYLHRDFSQFLLLLLPARAGLTTKPPTSSPLAPLHRGEGPRGKVGALYNVVSQLCYLQGSKEGLIVSGEAWPCRLGWFRWSSTPTITTLLNCPWQTGLLFLGSSNMETQQSPGPSTVPVYPSALCHLSQYHCFPVACQAAVWIPGTPSVWGALVVLHSVCLVICGICLKMEWERVSCRWCYAWDRSIFPVVAENCLMQDLLGVMKVRASASICGRLVNLFSFLPSLCSTLMPVFQLPLFISFA